MKELSRKYYILFPDIKHFYIEFKNDLSEHLLEYYDTIYIKGTETVIPGILYKTQKAMEYINNTYNYTYVIRTNLSSFWNLHKLLQFYTHLPKHNLCCGHKPFNTFISGTGIILSKNVVCKLISLPINNLYLTRHDDVYISTLLQNCNYILTDITMYGTNIQYLINNTDIPDTESPNILYYRIKTEDRSLDVYIFKHLLLKIYNIID